MRRTDTVETTQAPKGGYKTTPKKPKKRGGVLGAVEDVGHAISRGAEYLENYSGLRKPPPRKPRKGR